ncbi:MAG: topoisomerase protein [Candidatus Roizmanbacteria bacterium GW2011_GWA2_35_8]|uniref:DNA topoisomerase 1 n=1 Tax=Candidatus Roizmanbacteria bacterium GW2011_GWA2_35_8 TaxID=1618479 RepID=A0A0G0DDP5_9BACT|nr:MAG: topoisomerase protein [Candidatus Roizmanbacteria bacterium GW2011_GWA2_35_8]
MALIIVESPTKARTFNRILKQDKGNYFVYATMGHIRDLPSNSIAINYGNNFEPNYIIIDKKQKVVDQLKKLSAEHDEIILATDLDREGEAISYHVAFLLGKIDEKWPKLNVKDKNLKRIVFHEITSNALKEALNNPSTLRLDLVKAQQARRILDRVVGYELSPVLWKKTGKNWLSAGRVQTVALRIIVEREKEIKNFKLEDYYQIYGLFQEEHSGCEHTIKAKLISKDNVNYEQKETLILFSGEYTYAKTSLVKKNIEGVKSDLESDSYIVSAIDETPVKRYPPPPFTTSLLQQDAFYKFGFSSKMTMHLAQNLYERGLITYHRTDSFNLSSSFVFKAKDYIVKTYGDDYALEKPRGFRTKSRNAQEAHEAIRPTKLEPNAKTKTQLTTNHKKLYSLIFNRAVATQMKEAEINSIKVSMLGKKGYLLVSETEQIIFDGFFKLLNPKFADSRKTKPELNKGDEIKLASLEVEELKTKPPPRFNEASLIRILEEKGIGRPSTYAPIISLIQQKNYVEKDGRYFIPTPLGNVICDYLVKSFKNLFNLDFTANMEESLDKVAENNMDFISLLKDFYSSFKSDLDITKNDPSTITVEDKFEGICPQCKSNLVSRFSKFGKFIACSSYPKCKYTKSILKVVKGKLCPKDGGEIVVRFSKNRKRFYGCSNYPKCNFSAWTLADIDKTSNIK